MWIDDPKFADPRRVRDLHLLAAEGAPLWLPDRDNVPQLMAYLSPASVIGFGGAAGGGKSDLGIGKALNQHTDSFIARLVMKELQPIIDRIIALRGTRDGYSGGAVNRLVMPERDQTLTFASLPNLGDEHAYQGHPHDFKFYDEATNFLLRVIRFLGTWMRNTRNPEQPYYQQLYTFNPPQTAEGRWVIDYFAPWLDRNHKNPAAHGEIRHFVTVGRGDSVHDEEVSPEHRYLIHAEKPIPSTHFTESDFVQFAATEKMSLDVWKKNFLIVPQSRTFIGSRVTDNKYQSAEYMAQLQALPEPLRSQMLMGDFYAGMQDSEWQVIPSSWIEAAMNRWQPRDVKPAMSSMGVDVARGGNDNSIIARRHENWYDVPLAYPGAQTPDGPLLAGLVVAARRDHAPIHIDVVGVGGSPYDFLKYGNFQVIAVNGGSTEGLDGYKSQGGMFFANWKSACWWLMREDLDPANNRGVALPPDKQLAKDLAAPTWKPQSGRIRVESREDIIKRIGRSPDWGSAYIMARMDTPKLGDLQRTGHAGVGHNPLAILENTGAAGGHDPYA